VRRGEGDQRFFGFSFDAAQAGNGVLVRNDRAMRQAVLIGCDK
jgi:hypothetical protein